MVETDLPPRLSERIALFQRVTASRRIVLVLDGVADPAQVCVLFPSGDRSCVVLTSRHMHSLNAHVRLRLGALGPDEAVSLLERLVGDRVKADPESAARLVELCGGEPLALTAAAARLAAKGHWSLHHFVARLRDGRHRLDELSHGQPGVRAVLEGGYRSLRPDAASMYRHLGLMNADGLEVQAAALLAVSTDKAESILEEMVDAALLDVDAHTAGAEFRYRIPTLLALYARERVEVEETAAVRDKARRRLIAASGIRGAPINRR